MQHTPTQFFWKYPPEVLFTNVTLPYMSHIIGVIGVKADKLSSVRWKYIRDVHCTDRVTVAAYRCIEEDNFIVNCKRCLIFPLLFEAWAVGVSSLHQLHLQCNCSILSLPLYMFVVTVLTTLPSLC